MNEVGLRAGDVRRAKDLGAKLRGAPMFEADDDSVRDLRDPLPSGLADGLPGPARERLVLRRMFGAAWMLRAGEWARHCSEGGMP